MINRNDVVKRNPQFIKRNPPEMVVIDFPANNIGGHMPHPPKDCERKEYFFKDSRGVVWIDISLCHTCLTLKACAYRKAYLTALKERGNKDG